MSGQIGWFCFLKRESYKDGLMFNSSTCDSLEECHDTRWNKTDNDIVYCMCELDTSEIIRKFYSYKDAERFIKISNL
jgi:hypothetical protein